jgi:mersacidin/lichenicidin family type 2 lantibiotic
MTRDDIIRSWKNDDEKLFSKGKRRKQKQEKIPPNPVGEIELSDAELKQVAGGTSGCNPTGDIHIKGV